MEPMDVEKALEQMYEASSKWLDELGLGKQMPTMGVFKLLHSVIMDYWSEQGEEDGFGEPMRFPFDPQTATLKLEPAASPMVAGSLELQIVNCDGQAFPIGLIVPDEDYMILKGHKITIGSSREVEARHKDGSLCEVGCKFCEEPDIRLAKATSGYFVECATCGATTTYYQEKFVAIAAWTLGRIEA